MSSIKVIDVNEETAKGSLNSNSVGVETKQEAVEEPQVIEEAKEEIVEPTKEVVDDLPVEEVKEEATEKPKAKAKPKASDKVNCKTCDKSMSYKNYRYRHEKICSEEPKPVKPQANPKGKSKPKAQPVIREVEVEEVEQPKPKLTQPVSNQVLKPTNPLIDITNHYQLLQNQYIQQKKEKYNNLCQNMFAPKSKKRWYNYFLFIIISLWLI